VGDEAQSSEGRDVGEENDLERRRGNEEGKRKVSVGFLRERQKKLQAREERRCIVITIVFALAFLDLFSFFSLPISSI